MTSGPFKAAILTTLGLVLLGGCGAASGEPEGSVSLLEVDAPLEEPTYIHREDILLALEESGRRMVRLDPEAGVPVGETPDRTAVIDSLEIEDAGENIDYSPRYPNEVYLPQPDLDRVANIRAADLRKMGSLQAGEAPTWVAVHPGSETLFALSESGSTVTGVDLESHETTYEVEVGAGEEALIVSPEEGLTPEFWVAEPGSIVHYSGYPPERKVGMPVELSSEAFALDSEASQKAYAGEDSGRVLVAEGDPEGLEEGELLIEAETELSEEPEYFESRAGEELRLYAATEEKMVVMRYDTLEVLDTVDFRRPLEKESLEEAPVSGLTVGTEDVYLTFEGEPYVLSIDKP